MLIAIFMLLLVGDERVPAHKMSEVERMRRRMHEGDAALRRLRAEMDGEVAPSGTGVLVVGKHNPELLSRWELMNHLEGTLNSEPHLATYAPLWRERGAAQLLGEGYLDRLQKAMAPLLNAQKEFARLQNLINRSDGDALTAARKEQSSVTRTICPARAQALAAARKEFGHEAFDRFLYEVVAPEAVFSSNEMTPEQAVDMAQWLEAGCP